jgi:CheY-like chemotaxis protein
MDGIETLQAIRALGAEVPVAILITSAEHNIQAAAKAAGFNHVLSKPVSFEELQNCLKTSLTAHEPGWLATQQHAADAESALKARYAGTKVLLVEDEPINQEICRQMLEDVGLVVTTADDGQAACEMLQQDRFAVVLMDMQMPVMGGLEATRRIRCYPECADIPIVALTANAFAEDKARCLEAGMNDFLSKPTNPQMLFAILLKWLARNTHGDPVDRI